MTEEDLPSREILGGAGEPGVLDVVAQNQAILIRTAKASRSNGIVQAVAMLFIYQFSPHQLRRRQPRTVKPEDTLRQLHAQIANQNTQCLSNFLALFVVK